MSFRMALAMSTIFGLILCFLIVCIGVVLQEAGMSKVNFVIDVEDILKQKTKYQNNLFAIFIILFQGIEKYGQLKCSYVISIVIIVMALIIICLGIMLYLINWSFFTAFCTGCNPGNMRADTFSTPSTEINADIELNPPKYEEIELHTILHPYSPSVFGVSDYPPKYEV